MLTRILLWVYIGYLNAFYVSNRKLQIGGPRLLKLGESSKSIVFDITGVLCDVILTSPTQCIELNNVGYPCNGDARQFKPKYTSIPNLINDNPDFQLHTVNYIYNNEAQSELYQFKPHFMSLLEYLLDQQCRIAFFSRGIEERNVALLDQFLSDSRQLGKSRYAELKQQGQFEVYSKHHLDHSDCYRCKANLVCNEGKKVLQYLLKNGQSIDNTVLVQNYHSPGSKDETELVHVDKWFDRNLMYYLLGYFKEYFEQTPKLSLREFAKQCDLLRTSFVNRCTLAGLKHVRETTPEAVFYKPLFIGQKHNFLVRRVACSGIESSEYLPSAENIDRVKQLLSEGKRSKTDGSIVAFTHHLLEHGIPFELEPHDKHEFNHGGIGYFGEVYPPVHGKLSALKHDEDYFVDAVLLNALLLGNEALMPNWRKWVEDHIAMNKTLYVHPSTMKLFNGTELPLGCELLIGKERGYRQSELPLLAYQLNITDIDRDQWETEVDILCSHCNYGLLYHSNGTRVRTDEAIYLMTSTFLERTCFKETDIRHAFTAFMIMEGCHLMPCTVIREDESWSLYDQN